MPISARAATEKDLSILVTMNKRLIEDEGHRNPMSLDQLRDRMQSWLTSNWAVNLFSKEDNAIVGYSAHHSEETTISPMKRTSIFVSSSLNVPIVAKVWGPKPSRLSARLFRKLARSLLRCLP